MIQHYLFQHAELNKEDLSQVLVQGYEACPL